LKSCRRLVADEGAAAVAMLVVVVSESSRSREVTSGLDGRERQGRQVDVTDIAGWAEN
jgi:hypothetical protein